MRKPDASELVNKGIGWNAAELAAVGLEINSSGDVVPTAAAMAARGGGAVELGGPAGLEAGRAADRASGRVERRVVVLKAASPRYAEHTPATPEVPKPEGATSEQGTKTEETTVPAK